MIKAAIFDMDGLLIDSEPLWRIAEAGSLAAVGVHPRQEEIHNMLGRGIHNYVKFFYHKYPWKGPTPDEVADEITQRLVELVKEKGTAKPGVEAVLRQCKAKGLKQAVASSSPDYVIQAVLEKLGIAAYFDEVYSGMSEPHGKPHPGVFISVAERLGVSPLDCIVFEDAPSGVLAAKAARMHCIVVPEPEVKDHPYIQIADEVLDSLEDFNPAVLE